MEKPWQNREQRALEWHAANLERTVELNNMLDACADIQAKRLLFATFTKEEQAGLLPEYNCRQEARRVPIGALVRSVHETGFFDFITGKRCLDLAMVLGQVDHRRYLFLFGKGIVVNDKRHLFAEAQSIDLKEVT